ncbi:negative transcriptional regulator [Biscogniauxia mediterranea]|nr:negative transcriptional regulator [Biscogniauxia mediterranea]
MYIRSVHAERSIPILRQLIRDYPLGILTTAIPSTTYPFIQSSHIPFILHLDDESSETELGRLRGHMARANPQSKAIIDACEASKTNVLEQEVLVLFTSPVQHYVTPKFYTETKPDTGKVVPTWNYAAAQAYGKATIYYDTRSADFSSFLSKQLDDISRHSETSVMGYTGVGSAPGPWKVSDAPENYIEIMKKAIIGIEISIERLEGKFKMSQELKEGDREGVVKGFQKLDSEVAQGVASLVEIRGGKK